MLKRTPRKFLHELTNSIGWLLLDVNDNSVNETKFCSHQELTPPRPRASLPPTDLEMGLNVGFNGLASIHLNFLSVKLVPLVSRCDIHHRDARIAHHSLYSRPLALEWKTKTSPANPLPVSI